MFKNVFGKGGQNQGSGDSANPTPQEGQGSTVGDIFFEEAVKAAGRASQPATGAFPPAAAIDSDVFLSESPEDYPNQPQRQPGQPYQQQQQQTPGQAQHQANGPQVFIPQNFKTPGQLRAEYDRLKAESNRIVARLNLSGEQDVSKNPYALQGANGQVQFDQAKYNRDQLKYQTIDRDMREIMMAIDDAKSGAAEVVEQVKRSANMFFQQQFAGRRAAPEFQRLAGVLFARHVNQLVKTGFLLDSNNLTSHALESHFRNLFYAALGEATAQSGQGVGPGPGSAGAERPYGTAEDDPNQQKSDPYAGWPEESKKMLDAFERMGGTKPRTLAEAAKQQREGQNSNGGSR